MAGQNLTVRFQINRIKLEEFEPEGAIASLKVGQNLTVRFQINLTAQKTSSGTLERTGGYK
jgi:hypothetical protein